MTLRIAPDADAEHLRTAVRDFLQHHCGTEAVFREMAGQRGWDPEIWRRFAAELGAVALDVPEKHGGAGASFREVAVVAEELGRSLARLPWFSTAVLGVGVLLHCGGADALRAELFERVAAGEATATLAHLETAEGWDPGSVRTRAERDGVGRWRVSGAKTLVVEGACADVLFVVAVADGAPGVFVVEGDAEGVVRTPMRALDPNRQLADLVLDAAPARRLGDSSDASPVIDRVLDRALAALACEQTGGAAAAMDMSISYAAQRIQFGRPIGTFQAIKHRCADMAMHVEAARSASLWAAAAAANDPGALPAAAATAAVVCSDAYAWVSGETVQVHGGIGFTWEHAAHLHVRRATTSAALFGRRQAHRERLLTALGL